MTLKETFEAPDKGLITLVFFKTTK